MNTGWNTASNSPGRLASARGWRAAWLPLAIGALMPLGVIAQPGHSGAVTKPMPAPSFGRHQGLPGPAVPHPGGGVIRPPAAFPSRGSGWDNPSRGWAPPPVNGPGYALPPARPPSLPSWQHHHHAPAYSPPTVVVRPPQVYGSGYRHPYAGAWHTPAPPATRWFYSRGFRPGYAYPRLGLTVPALGAGVLVLGYAGTRWYVDQGVWYQPGAAGYVVANPPVGALVPRLPADYAAIVYSGVPYFYASGVYYVEVPGQGYRVVPPPADLPPLAALPSPAAPTFNQDRPGDPTGLPQFPDLQVTPRAGQSSAQYFDDRSECARLASEHTGFDPSQPLAGDARGWERAGTFRQYESTCLVARGYDVR